MHKNSNISLVSKLKSAENSYNLRPTDDRAVLLLVRYVFMSIFSNDTNYIKKGVEISEIMLHKNKGNGYIRILSAYLNLLNNDMQKVKSILKPLDSYKNYYKANDPLLYSYYLYIEGYIWYNLDRKKQTVKYLQQLKSMEPILLKQNLSEPGKTYFELQYNIKDLSILYSLIGDLSIYIGDTENSYKYLGRATNNENVCKAISFYGLYNLFSMTKTTVKINDDYKDLFSYFILKALPVLTLNKMIEKEKENLQRTFITHPDYMETVYEYYKSPWLLKDLVAYYITNNNITNKAYKCYKEAEKGQIQNPKLPYFIVKGAMENEIEDMSYYFMNIFLESHESELDDDISLKAFIYHILVSDEKMETFLSEKHMEIISFSAYALENNYSNRYFNSLYCYMLKFIDTVNLPAQLIKKCEEIVIENLFLYKAEVTNPEIERIFIFEKEKKNLHSFDVVDGAVDIISASSDFNYFSMANKNKEIITDDLYFKKQIENADYETYKYLHAKNYEAENLTIALTNSYLSFESIDDIPEEAIDVLNTALYLRDMSINFRTKITAGLGSILIKQDNLDKAVEYFKGVDENFLNDMYIEQMLKAFLKAKFYRKAWDLLIKKSYCISIDTKFDAVVSLCTQKELNPDDMPSLSNIAAELILHSKYHNSLVVLILKEYTGSQEQWLSIRKSLIKNASPLLELDEIILYNTIWIHNLDIGSQEIFANLCKVRPRHNLVKYFSIYLTYEILINNKKPIYEAIDSLEKVFFNKDNDFGEFTVEDNHQIAYALTHFYLTHNVNTINSDNIIELSISFMELDNIIIPVIKNVKDFSDYNMKSHFIFKNRSFIYKASPDKTVTFNYRTDSNEAFTCINMNYLKFGIYMCIVPHFYLETIEYFFAETSTNEASSSIETLKETIVNNDKIAVENSNDEFFDINNALIYKDLFKFDLVEDIIYNKLKHNRSIKSTIID